MKQKLPKFSARLKQLRAERKLKQSDIAAFLGTAYQNYQKIEYGQINVSASTVERLADYFNVSTDYLLGRTDKRKVNQ